MRGRVMLSALIIFGVVLQGCNTVAGMGKDMSRAGSAITAAAER